DFSGKSSQEADDFIQAIHKIARDNDRSHDPEWMAELASVAFKGNARRWFNTLTFEQKHDWGKLEEAISQKYPPDPTSDSVPSPSNPAISGPGQIPSSSNPTPGAGQFPPFPTSNPGQFPPSSNPNPGAGQFPSSSNPTPGAGQFPPFPTSNPGQFPPSSNPNPGAGQFPPVPTSNPGQFPPSSNPNPGAGQFPPFPSSNPGQVPPNSNLNPGAGQFPPFSPSNPGQFLPNPNPNPGAGQFLPNSTPIPGTGPFPSNPTPGLGTYPPPPNPTSDSGPNTNPTNDQTKRARLVVNYVGESDTFYFDKYSKNTGPFKLTRKEGDALIVNYTNTDGILVIEAPDFGGNYGTTSQWASHLRFKNGPIISNFSLENGYKLHATWTMGKGPFTLQWLVESQSDVLKTAVGTIDGDALLDVNKQYIQYEEYIIVE
ncbi:hypothetical protein PHLCEN_2v9486, partial [Hermanssonia centrifuga]